MNVTVMCPREYLEKEKGVKYPEVERRTYYSKTCEKERNVNILLPEGYSPEKSYPVLYFLHGIFGDENTMISNSTTIQNMMKKGVAKEMIVVYPYTFASKRADTCMTITKQTVDGYNHFIHDLVDDLMPYMKENYAVAEGKDNTAILGFSMGGRQALSIALQRPDLFGYIGAIAPAPGLVPAKDWAMEHEGEFAEKEVVFKGEKPYKIFICAGDVDKVVGVFPKTYHKLFAKNGIEHTWWEIPESDHGDPAVSSGVYNFCKEVFCR